MSVRAKRYIRKDVIQDDKLLTLICINTDDIIITKSKYIVIID